MAERGFDLTVYVTLAPLVFLGMAILLARSWRAATSAAYFVLVGISIFLMGWIVSGTFMVYALKESEAFFWLVVCQFFIIGTTPIWSLFILCIIDEERWFIPQVWGTLLAITLLDWAILFTNPIHNLFWTSVHFETVLGAMRSEVKHGLLFWLHTGITYSIFLIATIVFYREAFRVDERRKKQFYLIVWSGIIPFVANSVHKLHLIPGFEKDFTPLFFGISTILLNRVLKENLQAKWKRAMHV